MYITWPDLGLLILFILGCAVGTYVIILVKNLNSSIKTVKELLDKNKGNINDVLKDLPVITKNLAEITDTAKDEIKIMGNAINNINETVELTAAAAQTIKKDIFGKATSILGIIDFIKHFFFKEKEDKTDKKSEKDK